MNNEIEHLGRITSITNDVITILITSKSACGSCSAKSSCGMSEQKNKKIDIYTSNLSKCEPPIDKNELYVGQTVEVYMQSSKGTKAVIYGYLIPFIILVGVLVAMLSITNIEWLSALISIATVGIYYFSFKLFFSKKLKEEFTFYIRKV